MVSCKQGQEQLEKQIKDKVGIMRFPVHIIQMILLYKLATYATQITTSERSKEIRPNIKAVQSITKSEM